MGRRRDLGLTAAKCLAAVALACIGGLLLWEGARADRPVPEGAVVFLGDSITEFCDLTTFYPELDTVNQGISGDTTAGMLDRLGRVYAAQPEIVVVHGGINDILSGWGEDQVEENLDQIVRSIHEALPQAKVVVQSLYPIAEGEERYFTGIIQRVNACLKARAGELEYVYADVFPALQTSDGRLDSRYSEDGLHPNAAGYEAAAPVVRRAIEQAAG